MIVYRYDVQGLNDINSCQLDKGCDRDIYLRLYGRGRYLLRRSVAFAHDEEEGPESFMRI